MARKPVTCKPQKTIGDHHTEHCLAPGEDTRKVMGRISARLAFSGGPDNKEQHLVCRQDRAERWQLNCTVSVASAEGSLKEKQNLHRNGDSTWRGRN